MLAPKKVLPTYKMLVEDAKPPLPSDEAALALDVAKNPKVWDDLLKRPFFTLKADGPFIYERAQVDALVTDKLGSLGDPPTPLRLTLVRFRLEGINTSWRVIKARRRPPRRPRPRRGAGRGTRPNRDRRARPNRPPVRSLGDLIQPVPDPGPTAP